MKFVTQLLERLQARSPAGIAGRQDGHNPNIATIIHDALASAGLDKSTSRGGHIAEVIDDALTRAGLLNADVISGKTAVSPEFDAPVAVPRVEVGIPPAVNSNGHFLSRTYTSPAGALLYKLYVPSGYNADSARSMPLLVMLHGCTQSPDDFATGTRMNALADQHGFLVAYPAQSTHANGSKCWNWFRAQDQARGSGEPALITGMTAQVSSDYRVDPARVYVAGLSAGAAMAVVLGRTYPDVFAAVGAHSGLPHRAAHDMGSAFAAMQGGARQSPVTPREAGHVMPTIVFHGDRDHTVSAANGEAIVAQATGAYPGALHVTTTEQGLTGGGRGFLCTTYADVGGETVVEDWRVHGAGHAWTGGSATGSYTDPQGPDASAEMVRFFLQHARQPL